MKIISELCQNHNGNMDLLESMIKSAASNSDILKIQSIKADTFTNRKEYESFRPFIKNEIRPNTYVDSC